MELLRPITAEIKARGQLTIPKRIREWTLLEEGQAVSIIPAGDALIITPRRLPLEDARREMRRILKQSGRSLEELLDRIQEEREGLYSERYRPCFVRRTIWSPATRRTSERSRA
ncbi:MAG: AbrB/MazE/SpoVT family DNA-binding domain-containing protein [Deltaproteobacteria bacterium]|nr:AbrB/MazE/SpoVT family DNA-binding domain-containing protein [Deltaproteobacteria bacterium]